MDQLSDTITSLNTDDGFDEEDDDDITTVICRSSDIYRGGKCLGKLIIYLFEIAYY